MGLSIVLTAAEQAALEVEGCLALLHLRMAMLHSFLLSTVTLGYIANLYVRWPGKCYMIMASFSINKTWVLAMFSLLGHTALKYNNPIIACKLTQHSLFPVLPARSLLHLW